MTDRGVRAVLIAGGVAAMVFGAVSLFGRGLTELTSVAVWFTVPAVLSDLVVLPVIAAVGAVLTARLSPPFRLPVQVALTAVGVLTIIAVPFVGGFGRRADNPTLLNRDYLSGWAVYVAAIVVGALIWTGLRIVRRRRSS